MNWLLGILIAFLVFLLVEAVLLNRARKSIPCRIVITGTRGKSSLTRILLAGIRTVESETWGKITGDVPLLLKPDGSEEILNRRGPARLHEQARLLINFHRLGARCLVLESMTISPEAMQAEMRMIKPTLIIMTNVRDDHRETLGDTLSGQMTAYLSTLNADSRWLTLDTDLRVFAERSSLYPAPVDTSVDVMTNPDRRDGIARELLDTAVAVLDDLGYNTESARKAMRVVASELFQPPQRLSFLGEDVTLLDAFSANDPQSLERLWDGWRRDLIDDDSWSVLLVTRADRPLRTHQFCEWLAGRSDVNMVHVAGTHIPAAARLLHQYGVNMRVLAGDPWLSAVSGPASMASAYGPRKVLVGMGNSRGLGLQLRVAALEAKS